MIAEITAQMSVDQIAVAETCLKAAHDGSLSFPAIVGQLIAAGFDGYTADYRRNMQVFYLPEGGCIALDMPQPAGPVAAMFDAAEVERLVRWAQSGAGDYSFQAFSKGAKAAGCAGYMVSFLGRRVVYFGRTAETHVEYFPT